MEYYRGIKRGFTVTQLVIVFVVTAIVVAVSLNITKAKLDSMISYTYYTAYNTLRTVAGEMVADGIDYEYVYAPKNMFENIKLAFVQEAYAAVSDCSDGKKWDASKNVCCNVEYTIPKNGNNFCKKFNDYVNVSHASCDGSTSDVVASAVSSTDFSGLKPDLVLRNGMRLYNVKNNPAYVAQLSGMPANDLKAYTIYVDLDGKKGNAVLWEDVFPFYVTLTGKVIPAYKSGLQAGGNNKGYLTVNVQYDTYPTTGADAGMRKVNIMEPKNTSFKNAACMSGYITSDLYCSGAPAKNAVCNSIDSDCQIIPIKPLRFF